MSSERGAKLSISDAMDGYNDFHSKDDEARKAMKRRIQRPAATVGKRPVNAFMSGEAMKELQKQKKEAREERRLQLADGLGLEENLVEDSLITDDKFELIEKFFGTNNGRTLMFFYQDQEVTGSRLDGHYGNTSNSNRRLIIATGENEIACGTCCFFTKSSDATAITANNITQDVSYGQIDMTKGILEGLEKHLSTILLPALKSRTDWGYIKESGPNKPQNEFFDTLDRFISTLSGARVHLNDRVILEDDGLNNLIKELSSPADFALAAYNTELVFNLEGYVNIWFKQIEQVLAESEQMRKEADDIGPAAELEHWRKRMAKFNSLLDQIKCANCKTVIGVLQAAKSKTIKYWKELDIRITDAANEAKDNVKYLYTLDKFFAPLSKCSPTEMIEHIPSLMNAIRMIHSYSQYYNTSERMTSLFVKVTNQMITTCKSYIREGSQKIWDQPRPLLLKKLKQSCELNEAYQRCFHRTKAKLAENSSERQFEFSENYIFGKFDTFCKRLEKLSDMLISMEELSGVTEIRIEGINNIITRYQAIVAGTKKKSYDILEHRKGEFDTDYEEFKRQIEVLNGQLQAFLDSWFDRGLSTPQALELLQKFEKIGNSNLDLTEKYTNVLFNYGRDLEITRKIYQKFKQDPPIARNLPPIAGKITWVRQLFRRIDEPMKVFKTKPNILKTDEARRIIRNFNKLASVLMEFELLYHRGWFRAVDAAKSGLQATLLIKHPENKTLFVNFDPQVLELVTEAKALRRLSLEIPESAQVLCLNEDRIKAVYDRLHQVLGEYHKTVKSIPEIVRSLIDPFVNRVDDAIGPGLTMLTWTSLNIDSYIDNIYLALNFLRKLVKQISDILEVRIEKVLESMSLTPLCDLSDEPATVTDFIEHTEKSCEEACEYLTRQSQLVESSVLELIDTLWSRMKPIEQENLELSYEASNQENKIKPTASYTLPSCCLPLYGYFNQRNIDALVKCTRLSLDSIKRRIQSSNKYNSKDNNTRPGDIKLPLFKNIPIWKQQVLSGELSLVLAQADESRALNLPVVSSNLNQQQYYKIISEHRDIVKVIITLNTIINTSKLNVQEVVKELSHFSELWSEDPNERVRLFMQNSPTLSEFENQIRRYEKMEEMIDSLPTSYRVGSVVFTTELLKKSLKAETSSWKKAFGRALNHKASADMELIFSFIENMAKRLSRPIKDLDDVRGSMAALMEIREAEIRIDMTISPIEESFALLNRFNMTFSGSDAERVDTLNYSWKKLNAQANSVQATLLKIEPDFKANLLTSVKNFSVTLENYVTEYDERGPMVHSIPPTDASERLTIFQARFDDLWSKYTTYSEGEQLFGLPVTEYPNLQRVKRELNLLQKLYSLYNAVIDRVNGYYDLLWTDVDIQKINGELQEFQSRCRKLPKALKEWQAYNDLKKKIDDFNETCPLLEMMSHKAMKARHWQRIAELTKCILDVESDSFTLRTLMEAPLLECKEDIEDICISAVKERDIEAKLKSVVNDWQTQVFAFATFKNRGDLLLKGADTAETVSLMEDSLMILGSLMSNRYNAPFKSSIQQWVQKLSGTTEIIESWLAVQNLWIYLEAVFVGGDIAKQLPQEAKRFNNIDKSWVKIMLRAHEIDNVVQCCVGDDMLCQLLPHLLEQLEMCQKSLSGYLEKKRLVFPRFFFVSDPALLEILGQASDSHTIQSHLLGIFDNIKTATFHDKEYDRIIAVNSKEGETIELEKPVMAQGNVEVWLGALLNAAQKSLHLIIRMAALAIQDQPFNLVDFLDTYPAQVGLLGLQMIWTRDSEEALHNAKYDKKIMSHTNQHFQEILNGLIEVTTKELPKSKRVKYETLITIHVHQRDIFDDLVRMHIRSPTDFEWLKQSRFYFREDSDQCIISITDVDFTYQNEFLGCCERLVVTPLTDRCYITLAQALGMAMGGAPAGPAGTGKTETVKDMGKALGKYVVVFNCSDQMDYRGLGRIYKGLAQSGSWGCFDEFNRIELPVLSVAAQQIAVVLTCKKERKRQFIFTDGDVVDLNPEFGLFLTMNPGYAGRQELPENLKIQFRTVAMMVPDRQIIIRVKLASCGFQNNQILARKFFILYKLCEEQLTKQVHYDFGLRNILSVLRTLGAAKRSHPDDSESTIMMRVLRDMNLSKLVDEDEPLFLSLIDDLFPGIQLEKAGYPELEGAICKQAEDAGLIYHPPWVLKLIQLYETQRVRHGMMALGPSGAGKTTCIQTLMKAMTDIGIPHREMRMNPKAITASEMFGKLDVSTNDWTDGVFSALWRKTLKTKKGEHIWIVLDGPVDAIWIENLNSVLDDNKTLTLANGDRIPMSSTCKIIFEPHNIDNASPATVSRNGMVYMSSSVLDWRPILQSWLKRRPVNQAQKLTVLFEGLFDDAYNFVVRELHSKMDVLECNYIAQAISLLEGLISSNDDNAKEFDEAYLDRLFIFALMWSLGALIELDDRRKLQDFLINRNVQNLPDLQSSEDTIFEYLVNEKGEWIHWSEKVPNYFYPTDSTPEYSSILVPNVDNVRTNFLIDTIAKQHKAVLLIGEQGTAKTVMIKKYMANYDPERHLVKSLNFSSASTPILFQRSIESYVDKRMGSTFGPPAGKKMTVFVDDINMPTINEWGDQVTNEIVRQLMEMKGFYNLEKPGDFTNIADLQFIAAMIQPGGGRNDIPSRLKRQFAIFNCTLPSDASIDKIFRTIGEGYFCAGRGFNQAITSLIESLASATRRLWQKTKVKMLPTPAKFHYVFNLRDLSRIWQGMLAATSDVINHPKNLFTLWKHECLRVIADRFVSKSDVDWFQRALNTVVENDFGESYLNLVNEEHYFVDFLRDAPEVTGDEVDDSDFETPKIYEPIESFEQLSDRLIHYLMSYNEAIRGAALDLVFFKDAMIHLMRISRIIRLPHGNCLLVGVGGSGKQSLTRLATFIAGYQIFQITLTRSYSVTNLLDDLKILYRNAGLQGSGVTFIFTDNEIKDESFLEYLNNVLASGEVSNLFARDEIDEITQELIPVMKAEYPRRLPTLENLYDYFLTRVRNNLHVVLCFSPVGEKFRNRALKFPALFSGCTMDWFSRWPKDALIAVAQHFISSYPIICSDKVKQSVIGTMGTFQDRVSEACVNYFERFRRQAHVTPKSYLSFINGYKLIYRNQKESIGLLAERMRTGLDKLVEATQSVNRLSEELIIKEKELEIASDKADVVLKEVTAKAHAAEKVKQQVLKVKEKAQAIVDEIAVDKAAAEERLEAAKPALEEAEAALQTIKAQHIATVRKLAKPPHLIMRIMDCVLLLFNKRLDPTQPDPEKPTIKPSWGEALRMMNNSGFLQSLVQFQKDSINDETVELLEIYFANEDYNIDTAKKACGDVAGLLSWTKAMCAFYAVNKEVLPLKANLMVQEARLNQANGNLTKAQNQFDEKQAELDAVQKQYEAAVTEKQNLINDAETCRRKMNNATTLIDGLGGEKIRWTEQSKMFEEQTNRLVGDVLLATGFLSYSGPFNQEFRSYLSNVWKKEMRRQKIPFTEDLDLVTMLTDSATIGEWNLQGLPNDELSIENGLIATKASRFPLLIDPQGQGKVWIKNREAPNELQVTSLNHKYFRAHLEDCLSLGRPLLIEDINEELDPALDNVLEKNFIKIGKTLKVKVGDKEIDILEGFRLYITTKLPNPAYTPEISARTSIIDFTVTMKGLEGQLLGRVIQTEKKELELERTKLIEEVTFNRRKIKDLEDNLLLRLTSTEGSLVDDESLIAVLANTKKTAEEVRDKLAVAAETETKINIAREEYRPVATRGSILYFLIVEMSMVNVMYQTSLAQFLKLFDLSMVRSQKSPIPAKRIQNVIDYLTFAVFKYTVRGLYENHKFLFTLLLALKIDLQQGRVKSDEFQVLIKGGAALDLNNVDPKPKKWIPDITWLNLVELSKLPQFSQILGQISRNDRGWKSWYDEDAPEEAIIPDGYSTSLDTLRKLLLVRCWCPDRTIPQARHYIIESIGSRYAEGVILDLENMWEESNTRTPMICFLSMGSDPTASIEALAKKMKLECRAISMGQGQEIHARRLLSQTMSEGGWLMLQNCHLGLNFMEELLETILNAENADDSFRVWMTTDVHPQFPINILQHSIKFTNEPPQGAKAGLKRTYGNITQDQLDITNMPQWKPMLYGVAFLHTVVQERRKFGPLGWNIPYEFNEADLTATVQFVQNHLDDMDIKKGVSWNTVRYMIGEVQYGGRVTDDFDKRLINTFARTWFSDAMFADNFRFYEGYRIPKCKTIEDYRTAIDSLPLVDSPEAFGLHPNADITYQTKTATDILDTIVNIQPKDSASGGGETRESVVLKLAMDMLEKLPPDYIAHEVKDRLQKMGLLSPMNIFLRQEIDRMQCVISAVRQTLTDLKLAIDGTIIMSEILRDALDNMYDARVPVSWRKVSWESSTLGFWFTELLERNAQFHTWLFEGRPNVFHMTSFFNPQGFLTAMRQEVTRAHKGWALDNVVLANDVTKHYNDDIATPPAEGVYVHGLYLEGAGWERRACRLTEPSPKVLYTPLPVVHIYAVNVTTARENNRLQPPDHWTLRGVALLCDIK
ncbi:uncharacterized protein TRIADDRAFT_56504 [Trichoplax adhaerens]|uniref:AAA+ ATPase domain-containing protein n=1 Tax=Trichoplax adhaerens TaxID=10228 RepID=B3RYB9_TRIAD|nr:hypothetical protein TRIADDRAFT_56504 [Trichoplax adhaerens]EDV25010.1 hypothetical protein TRIADDRAFT_56504 [Trichoplax adhaerens]|eukprot:XP_002112900.1 hypothetical protein TRIADDRAFT_56504 [Trichoplax adhaerens]